MEYQEILKQLQKKIYHPIYVLMGEEAYFIDQISNYIEKEILTPAEQDFDRVIVYGKDTTTETIVMAARRYPMVSSHQVIIVKEAQMIKDLEEGLLPYLEKPLKSTILVICYKYKTIDKRKKFTKLADSLGVVFESKKIYENKVPSWIQEYCAESGYKIEIQASMMLSEFLGTNISNVVNELNKLMIVLPKGTNIRPEDIEKNIGISKDFNVFELQEALGTQNVLKANRIINHFALNPNLNPIQKTIAALFSYFSKLFKMQLLQDKSETNIARELGINPYFAKSYIKAGQNYPARKITEVISILREYDMKSKGIGNVSTSMGDLQKEMIYKILH